MPQIILGVVTNLIHTDEITRFDGISTSLLLLEPNGFFAKIYVSCSYTVKVSSA